MFCHFISAFAALGMPPFFALILEQTLHNPNTYLAGWFYVVPTLFTAISSPWWGRFADRVGKKISLLRAQLGLSISFLLAGYCQNTTLFFLALTLQGLLGGTFSATNAYLASVSSGAALAKNLTLMQGSARAALVVAPALLGILATTTTAVIELYRFLALLPLTAALLLWLLPEVASPQSSQPIGKAGLQLSTTLSGKAIFILQFAFIFASVVSLPYFIAYSQALFSLSIGLAGVLFGLPNLIYLVTASLLSRYLQPYMTPIGLAWLFLLMAISLIGQAQTANLSALIAWRILMGLAMTGGFIVLHALVASLVCEHSAGRTFGWLESSAKYGAVVAGIAAGVAVDGFALTMPFILGAGILLVSACWLAGSGYAHQLSKNV
ncbi:MAG: MFS transporter [Methylococcaceae bacterium]|jgi:MFS family permease